MRDTTKQIEIMNRQKAYILAHEKYFDIPRVLSGVVALSIGKAGMSVSSSTEPSLEETDEARHAMMRAQFALGVARGDLRSASNYPHAVPLAPDLIEAEYWDENLVKLEAEFKEPVEIAIERTATGRYDLWFNDDGYPFLSFENDGDAEMFVLALEGGAE